MSAQSGTGQGVDETYELLRRAATRKQPVAATYDDQPRLLCPHVLGRKAGRRHALVYQIGGRSNRGLPLVAAGGGVWRCLAVGKLSDVELRADGWRSEPRAPGKTCIDEVGFDTDAQPGDNPQNGQ
jgi:hypothetical protein